MRLLAAAALAVALAVLAAPRARTQAVPEYAVLVSAIAGGLQASQAVYSCRGPDLLAITEALKGPGEVQRIGNELVSEALGTPKKPWPRNRRAYVNQGRRYVPDFVKGRSFFQVETGKRLELTPEIRGLQAIARRRGGDLAIVTRKVTALSPALVKAAKQSWRRKVGRLRIVRCI